MWACSTVGKELQPHSHLVIFGWITGWYSARGASQGYPSRQPRRRWTSLQPVWGQTLYSSTKCGGEYAKRNWKPYNQPPGNWERVPPLQNQDLRSPVRHLELKSQQSKRFGSYCQVLSRLSHLNRYFSLLQQRHQNSLDLIQGNFAKSLHFLLRPIEQKLVARYFSPISAHLMNREI